MKLLGRLLSVILWTASLQAAGIVWKGEGPQGFSAEITLPEGTFVIPQQIEVDFVLTYPEGYKADLQAVRANLLRNGLPGDPPFSLISQEQKVLSGPGSPSTVENVKFVLEPQLPGKLFVTPMNIPFLAKTGQEPKKIEIISAIFPVDVQLPVVHEPPDVTGISAPILDIGQSLPINLDFDLLVKLEENEQLVQKEAAYNAAVLKSKELPWDALGAAIGILLIWGLLKNAPRKRGERPVAVQSETAFHQAMDLLDAIEQKKDVDPAMADDYFVQLSHAVRFRIEEQHNLRAPSQTSQEFIRSLQSHPVFDEKTQGLLHDFLESTDQVKFARHHPSLDECRHAASTAKEVLESFGKKG